MHPPQSSLVPTLLSLSILLTSSLAAPMPVPGEASSPDVTKLFNGLGHIFVLNSTSYASASLADSIGCLSSDGFVTASDCAVFSTVTTYPKTISSKVGGCSFGNQDMPTNDDSRYGGRQHAWSCNEDAKIVPEGERYYTINGFKHPFICNGNLNCYYDIPRAPSRKDGKDKVFVWQFAWGSEQMGITPGHLQVLWVWVPLGEKDGDGSSVKPF
ncbi:hypothetical protein B0T20DRAFT_77600 [Sordaria brevicollis]|uniref:Uncharacterized protein n=1 Tax=Sordaria brevicollis TaxID=83679 RepID=A0AAE0P0V5_SORBR|nr:hypothetical protein B0T20DRAFT_77600 [Sordaria brevicollis]